MISKSKQAKPPIWKGYDLPKLRKENPHYSAGYHGFPFVGKTKEDRAAFQLGKDEASLSRRMNIFIGL